LKSRPESTVKPVLVLFRVYLHKVVNQTSAKFVKKCVH